jgi:inactivated superfamily I helicase
MMESEKSAWDIYNNIADIRDGELIKDWNDTLNFLLIFVSVWRQNLLISHSH